MKKTILVVLILACCFADSAQASPYTDQMKETLIRGVKNIFSSLAEIPITVQEYHEGPGSPVFRQVMGLMDGAVQAIGRAGSGLLDLVVAWIPGVQDGLKVEPETLF